MTDWKYTGMRIDQVGIDLGVGWWKIPGLD